MENRNQFIGNGQLNAIRSELITFADHTMVKIRANKDFGVAGEDPSSIITKITWQVDANGSDTDGHFYGLLKIYRRDYDDVGTGTGTAAAADNHEFTANGTEVVANSEQHVCLTLGDLVDELNTIPGITAHITDGPRALSLASAAFVDEAEDIIPRGSYLGIVTNDVSVSKDVYKRLGIPEAHNRGPLKIFDVAGTETGTTTLAIYTDDPEDGASDPIFSKVMTATQTSYLGYDETNVPTVKGPVILSFTSADMSALNQIVTFRQAANI